MKIKSKRNELTLQTIKKVVKYLKKYRLNIALTLLFSSFSVGITIYIPKLIGQMIDCIVGQNDVDFTKITKIVLTSAICIALVGLFTWLSNIINNRITFHVVRDIRRDAFNKIEILPLDYLDTHATGETVSRMTNDVDQFAEGLLMGFTQLFSGVFTIFMTFGFMLSISKGITAVVVILTPLSLFIASFIAKRTHSMFVLRAKTTAEQMGYIDEMINGQKVIAAFSQQQKTEEKFDEINSRLASCTLKAIFFSSLVNPSARFINSFAYVVVTLFGAFSVIGMGSGWTFIFGAITIGQLICLLSYANQFAKPFNEISGVITELQNALACAERIFALIDEKPQIPDNADAYTISEPSGEIALNQVYFSYTPEQKLIENFNLKVKSGQKIAIVGPTGCGKTTLINLLMRFYDVTSGSIQIVFTNANTTGDDTMITSDIRNITRKSLRHQYGMVLQDTWIKHGTIRDNIIIGKPDATDEEIIIAAKSSHAHSFIKRLQNGYDTIVGEDGGNLSQGQKQLLCITRVMLCLPPMLILDEATSSIDTRTEQRIQKAFTELMSGKTSFIVAHRLSTIREADQILVMNNGNIIEQGTHAQLMARNGFYTDLYNKASNTK